MLSESIRPHNIQASPTGYFPLSEMYETLPDQLATLACSHETLQQTNTTLKLENEQYKQHISELELQLHDLKQELNQRAKDIQRERTLKPILTEQISSMNVYAEEDAQEIKELKSIINKQCQSIKDLKTENITIKQQYEKCLIALETNKQQMQIYKHININNSTRNMNTIESLQNENQLLKEELNSIKLYYNTQNNMQTPMDTPIETPIVNGNTPTPIRISDTPVPIDSPVNTLPQTTNKTYSFNTTDIPMFVANRKRTCTIENAMENMCDIGMQIFQPNSSVRFSEFGGGLSENNNIEIAKYVEKIEVLKQSVERLEFDNSQLKVKLEEMENKNINDEESVEMELLFEKCADGFRCENTFNKLIDKYRLLKWEIQLREVQ